MQNPPLDLLKYEPFPELADALRASVESVLRTFELRVRDILPTAEELTFTQLRNSLPEVLRQMAKALESDNPADTEHLLEVTPPHGEIRFHQNYNINELIIEYHLLRRVLLEEVAAHLARPLEPNESVAINSGIDTALRCGVVTFVDYQRNELQRANELQSRYLSFLSHDLRGGLNGTLLMMEVLKRELDGKPELGQSLEDIDAMRRSILDTVATMERFLSAERLRKGKVAVRSQPLNLQQLVDELITQFGYTAREKGLSLAGQVQPGATLFSDRELILLILQNLIGNALKYTRKGHVVLESRCDGAEGTCSISVVDTGPGMPTDKLPELFQPFRRGQTHGQQGVGLGLSIVKQAADLLGASLEVTSTPGQGTKFGVHFPPRPPAESQIQ